MIPSELSKLKRTFFVIQGFIFLIAILAVVLFVSIDYVKKASESWISNLNNTANAVVSQLSANNMVVPDGYGDEYTIFVFDQEYGRYIHKRKNLVGKHDKIWESYHTKLVYEMQKQKRGWIFYPETNAKTLFKSGRVIRYLSIKELGWIVAVEAQMESQWDRIKEIFDFGIGMKLLGVLGICLMCLQLVSTKVFAVMKKMIADNLESGFMNLNSDDIWGARKSSSTLETKIEKNVSVESGFEPELISSKQQPQHTDVISEEFKDTTASFEQSKDSNFVQKVEVAFPELPSTAVKYSVSEKKLEKPQFDSSVQAEKVRDTESVAVKEGLERKLTNEESPLEGLTIDMKGIQSPILKKMIKELREK